MRNIRNKEAQPRDQDLISINSVRWMAGLQNLLGQRCNNSKLENKDGFDDIYSHNIVDSGCYRYKAEYSFLFIAIFYICLSNL